MKEVEKEDEKIKGSLASLINIYRIMTDMDKEEIKEVENSLFRKINVGFIDFMEVITGIEIGEYHLRHGNQEKSISFLLKSYRIARKIWAYPLMIKILKRNSYHI